MKKCNSFLSILFGFLVLIAFLLSVLDNACFDLSFYSKEYQKYNNAETIGISDEELMETTEVLLDYIADKRDDMVVYATIHGVEREVFNQREKDHMVDVKNLYLLAMKVKQGCTICAGMMMIYFIFKHKKQALKILAQGYQKACGIFVAIVAGLGIAAYIDFTSFWTLFHQIFFSNDLWLLNPKTDIMILMVPEGFFYDLVFKIATGFILIMLILLILAHFLKMNTRRKIYD